MDTSDADLPLEDGVETFDPVSEADIEIVPPEKDVVKGPGLKALMACMVISTLLGAGGGFALTTLWQAAPPLQDISALETQIAAQTRANEDLRAQVGRLKNEMQAKIDQLSVAPTDNVDAMEFTTRLARLEDAAQEGKGSADDITRLEKRIEALTAFDGIAPDSVPVEIATRLEALETSHIQITPDTLMIGNMSLREVLDDLQNNRGVHLSKTSASSPGDTFVTRESIAIVLPPFPEDSIRGILREASLADKNWIQRVLGRHVSVRKPGEQDPVDQVLAAIKAGDIEQAVAVVETLPSPARSNASEWMTAARHLLQTEN